MKLEEVLPAFREGKKIRRKCWPNSTYYFSLSSSRIHIDEADITLDDWEIVPDEPKPKVKRWLWVYKDPFRLGGPCLTSRFLTEAEAQAEEPHNPNIKYLYKYGEPIETEE